MLSKWSAASFSDIDYTCAFPAMTCFKCLVEKRPISFKTEDRNKVVAVWLLILNVMYSGESAIRLYGGASALAQTNNWNNCDTKKKEGGKEGEEGE